MSRLLKRMEDRLQPNEAQKLILFSMHLSGLHGFNVVIALQVEHAVEGVKQDFNMGGMAAQSGLPNGLVETNDQIALKRVGGLLAAGRRSARRWSIGRPCGDRAGGSFEHPPQPRWRAIRGVSRPERPIAASWGQANEQAAGGYRGLPSDIHRERAGRRLGVIAWAVYRCVS